MSLYTKQTCIFLQWKCQTWKVYASSTFSEILKKTDSSNPNLRKSAEFIASLVKRVFNGLESCSSLVRKIWETVSAETEIKRLNSNSYPC